MALELEPLDPQFEEEMLQDVRFGRSRLLKLLAGGVFGLATGLILKQEPASAQHVWPTYCFGVPVCHYCNGYTCYTYCWNAGYQGCPTQSQCWLHCDEPNSRIFRCCDWREQFPGYAEHTCVCGEVVEYRRCDDPLWP
jgi:hypothetical protein